MISGHTQITRGDHDTAPKSPIPGLKVGWRKARAKHEKALFHSKMTQALLNYHAYRAGVSGRRDAKPRYTVPPEQSVGVLRAVRVHMADGTGDKDTKFSYFVPAHGQGQGDAEPMSYVPAHVQGHKKTKPSFSIPLEKGVQRGVMLRCISLAVLIVPPALELKSLSRVVCLLFDATHDLLCCPSWLLILDS